MEQPETLNAGSLDSVVRQLAELAIRTHRWCEDTEYACPKHPAYSGKWSGCDCGADKHNSEVQAIVAKLSNSAHERPTTSDNQ